MGTAPINMLSGEVTPLYAQLSETDSCLLKGAQDYSGPLTNKPQHILESHILM